MILDWEDATDSDGYSLTYTLFLSKDDPDFNDPIYLEYLDYSICLLTTDDGIEDLSNYYWKVQAYMDATRWMKTPCAARSGEKTSRFVIKGRDAVATSFDDWQPSPLTWFGDTDSDEKP